MIAILSWFFFLFLFIETNFCLCQYVSKENRNLRICFFFLSAEYFVCFFFVCFFFFKSKCYQLRYHLIICCVCCIFLVFLDRIFSKEFARMFHSKNVILFILFYFYLFFLNFIHYFLCVCKYLDNFLFIFFFFHVSLACACTINLIYP